MPECNGLDEDVAEGSRLDRTGENRTTGGVGGKLIEQGALAPAANNVQSPDGASGDLLKFLKRAAIRVQKR